MAVQRLVLLSKSSSAFFCLLLQDNEAQATRSE